MTKHSLKNPAKSGPVGALYACAFSLLVAFCTAAVLLLVSAAIAYAQPDPAVLARPLAMVSLYASALLCGIVSAKRSDKPLLSGVIGGAGMVLVLFLISLLPHEASTSAPTPLLATGMHLGIIAASAAGAFIATKKPKKHSMKRGKKRRR